MNRKLFRWVLMLCVVLGAWNRAGAQPGCDPVPLPFFENFEDEGFHFFNGLSTSGWDSTYVLPDNCWLYCCTHEIGVYPMCGFLYWPPEMVRDNYLRVVKRNARWNPPQISEEFGITPVLNGSPTGISFKAAITLAKRVNSEQLFDQVDTVFPNGAKIVVGYLHEDSPITVIPNPNPWDNIDALVVGYDPIALFVPIDTLSVYSYDFTHRTSCYSNFQCKGVTVPPNSRIAFRVGEVVEDGPLFHGMLNSVYFEVDSITIFGDNLPPDLELTYNDDICVGESYEGYGFSTPGYSSPGTYTLTRYECTDTALVLHTLTLSVLPAKHTSIVEYISPDEAFHYNGETFTEHGDYTFMFTASNGCDSVVTLHLLYTPGEEPVLQLWLPNAFSPGQNGLNDEFLPVFNYPDLVEEYQMEIYNRWGNLVFRTEEMTRGWDGDGLTGGVYVCRVIYKPKGGKEKVVIGNVTIFK